MEYTHIAILVSYRFECLNVFLDIVKNNFTKKIKTHVFCNLSSDSFQKYEHAISSELIDYFHHIPDENCREGIQVNTGHKQEVKRKQPLDAFIRTLEIMSDKKGIEKFLYTECDLFPLSQEEYVKELEKITDGDTSIRYIESVKSGKTPFGYMSPSPVYFSQRSAAVFSDFLRKNRDQVLTAQISFEGILGYAAVKLSDLGYNFNKTYDNNIEPVSLTSHQHNIFNLEKSLLDYNITNGDWVNKIFALDSLKMVWPTVNDFPDRILKKSPGFSIGFMENAIKKQ